MGGSTLSAIDGQTRLMGLIGENIGYTLSPALHNTTLIRLGINAAYLPLAMPASQVRPFLDVAWHLGALGFNVTTPHKEVAAQFVPLADGTHASSVNTLYRGGDGWLAASTDGLGFAAGLQHIGRDLASFNHLVFMGAGGAVLAIVGYLAANLAGRPAPRLTVLRRGAGKDEMLRALWPHQGKLFIDHLEPLALASALTGLEADALLIQATSAPHQGDDLAAFVPALAFYRGVVVDLVYGRPSALYRAAVAKGLLTQDGEPMLIEQARAAQHLWWGQSANAEELSACMAMTRR